MHAGGAQECAQECAQLRHLRCRWHLSTRQRSARLNTHSWHTEFAGERGARAIAAAVTDLLHERAISAVTTEADLAAFAPSAAGGDAEAAGKEANSAGGGSKGGQLAAAILFTDKLKTTVLAKALSIAYGGRLNFGQVVKGAGDAVAEKLGVTEYPTLLVIKVGGWERAVYA